MPETFTTAGPRVKKMSGVQSAEKGQLRQVVVQLNFTWWEPQAQKNRALRGF